MFDWLPETQPQRALVVFALSALVLMLAIVPLVLLGGGDDDIGDLAGTTSSTTTATTPPPPPPTTTTPPPTTPPAQPTPKPPVERSIGQTATDDGVDFTVNSLREVDRIDRGSYYRRDYKPSRGGKLIAAEVTFVNNTNAPIDPFCGGNSTALVDQRGRSHETLDALYSIEGNDAVCGSAGTLTGDRATVTLAFRLDGDERISHLDLWNGKFTPDFDGETTRVRFRTTT